MSRHTDNFQLLNILEWQYFLVSTWPYGIDLKQSYILRLHNCENLQNLT